MAEGFADAASQIGPFCTGQSASSSCGGRSDRCKQARRAAIIRNQRDIAQAEVLAKAFVVAENK